MLQKQLFYYLVILDRGKEAGTNKYKRERKNKTKEEKRKKERKKEKRKKERNVAIIN